MGRNFTKKKKEENKKRLAADCQRETEGKQWPLSLYLVGASAAASAASGDWPRPRRLALVEDGGRRPRRLRRQFASAAARLSPSFHFLAKVVFVGRMPLYCVPI